RMSLAGIIPSPGCFVTATFAMHVAAGQRASTAKAHRSHKAIQILTDPHRSSQILTDPHRSSQILTDPHKAHGSAVGRFFHPVPRQSRGLWGLLLARLTRSPPTHSPPRPS